MVKPGDPEHAGKKAFCILPVLNIRDQIIQDKASVFQLIEHPVIVIIDIFIVIIRKIREFKLQFRQLCIHLLQTERSAFVRTEACSVFLIVISFLQTQLHFKGSVFRFHMVKKLLIQEIFSCEETDITEVDIIRVIFFEAFISFLVFRFKVIAAFLLPAKDSHQHFVKGAKRDQFRDGNGS